MGESKTSPPLCLRGGLRGGWLSAVPNFLKRYLYEASPNFQALFSFFQVLFANFQVLFPLFQMLFPNFQALFPFFQAWFVNLQALFSFFQALFLNFQAWFPFLHTSVSKEPPLWPTARVGLRGGPAPKPYNIPVLSSIGKGETT